MSKSLTFDGRLYCARHPDVSLATVESVDGLVCVVCRAQHAAWLDSSRGAAPADLSESEVQVISLALAELSLRRPGWNQMLKDVAAKLVPPATFEAFKQTSADIIAEWPESLQEACKGLWLGMVGGRWSVRGDGKLSLWSVYTEDASGSAVGFMPFGFALPDMLELQARRLAALLNLLNDMLRTGWQTDLLGKLEGIGPCQKHFGAQPSTCPHCWDLAHTVLSAGFGEVPAVRHLGTRPEPDVHLPARTKA